MLTDIAAAIVTRLQTLTGLATVTANPLVEQLTYPAAQVYLAKDVRVLDKPGVQRELHWVVQLTSYGECLDLVDAVRNNLSGWKMPGKGSTPVSIDLVELAKIEPGRPLTYLVRASVLVIAANYTNT